MRTIVFVIAAMMAAPAAAQTYGTANGGCELAAGNPVNDTSVYFDGIRLGGLGWTCELTPAAGDAYVGHCTDEGSNDPATQVTFTITAEGDTVSIASNADYQVLTLQRCE
jgi:hypothetical protein